MDSIQPIEGLICITCGLPLRDGGMHCHTCKKEDRHFRANRSFSLYDGVMKEAIRRFKYTGQDGLSRELAPYLIQTWKSEPLYRRAEVLIPVPLHKARLRERGFNQTDLLCQNFLVNKEVSSLTSLAYLPNALLRVRETGSQARLSREERSNNILGAFRVKSPELVRGKRILVVDDVCTTASTLNECARVLKKAGAREVLCLTLARD